MRFKDIKLCITIILRVLFGRENWTATVREEYRLREFQRIRL
jgi:hypothetical protein